MESDLVKMTAAPTGKKGGSGRNSEKRRERSKVAARCRRSKESEIFSELAEFLPLPENTRNALDKASIMRLILSDLKLSHMMQRVFSETEGGRKQTEEYENDPEMEIVSMLNNAMGGFLLVLSTEGDIIYASDSITTHLGLAQVEVMGLSIYDFSHPCDHGDIKELLVVNKKEAGDDDLCTRSSSLRMKCTITARGRNVHLRAASYKVIDFSGRMFTGNSKDPEGRWFVGVGEPLLHPSDVDIPLNKQTFLTRHSPDMKCEFVDDSIKSFLGYNPVDLVGKSVFEFHHALDGPALAKAFKSLYAKGQSITERYRFLAKHGGWVWVVTQATLMQSSNGSKPNSIVCLNFVTSGIENEEEIMSSVQKERTICKPIKAVVPEFKKSPILRTKSEMVIPEANISDKENVVPEVIQESKPITSTKAVIAPRTDDMDTGFLMPMDNDNTNTLIVSKEEPEDLEHLAPTAGDACVPLDQQIPLLDNLLKELEAANVPFSYNGYEIDVNFDDLPQLEMPTSISPATPEVDSDESETCGESSISGTTASPLFLNSDPPMVSSPGSKSSLLSPFQLSPNPAKSCRNISERSSSNMSSSSYELHPSPSSTSGYEDSRSPLPGLVGLTLQEDSFRGAILMDGQLNDPGPRNPSPLFASTNLSLPDAGYSVSPPDFRGPFVTLPDGRKFPVVPTSNPNEFIWAGDPIATTTDQKTKSNEVRNIIQKTGIPFESKKLEAVKLNRHDATVGYVSNAPTKQNSSLLSQLVVSSDSKDAYDGAMKVGGGPLPWNWDCVVPRVENNVGCIDSPKMYSSSGPPLAKNARLSESVVLPMRSHVVPSLESPWYMGSNKNLLVDTGGNNSSTRQAASQKSQINMSCDRKERGIGTGRGNTIGNSGSSMEHDLRSCLEQLLATGQTNKVTEIMSWLRNSAVNTIEDRPKPPEKDYMGLLGVHKDFQRGSLPKESSPNNRKRNNLGCLMNAGNSSRMGLDMSQQLPGLYELTRQDCEVNAPLNGTSRLLNGSELLTALDYTDDPLA